MSPPSAEPEPPAENAGGPPSASFRRRALLWGLAVVGGLAAALWFGSRAPHPPAPSPSSVGAATPAPVPSGAQLTIWSSRVVRPDDSPSPAPRCFSLRYAGKAQGGWFTDPGVRTRRGLAEGLWRALSTARPLRVLTGEAATGDFGLSRCRPLVAWQSAMQPSQALCFGDEAPGERIYARFVVPPALAPSSRHRDPVAATAIAWPRCDETAVDQAPLPSRGPPQVLVFERSLWAQLTQPAAVYRELHLLPLSSASLRRIELGDGSQVRRQAATWRDSDGVPIDAALLHDLLSKLQQATLSPPETLPNPSVELKEEIQNPSVLVKKDDFLAAALAQKKAMLATGSQPEAGPAIQRWIIEADDDSVELSLHRGPPFTVQRGHEPAVARDPDLALLGSLSARDLRDKRPLPLLPSAITALAAHELFPTDNTPPQRVLRRPFGFALEQPLAAAADAALVRGLLRALSELRGVAELPATVATQLPWRWRVQVSTGDRVHTLSFTAADAATGTCYVQLVEPARVIVLLAADCRPLLPQLATPWHSRSLLFVDDARLKAVQVRCGSEDAVIYSLTRRSDGWWEDEKRLSEGQKRQRLTDLHALSTASELRYGAAADGPKATEKPGCTLHVRHTPFAPAGGGDTLAPDSAPVEQCLSGPSAGWLRRCTSPTQYALSQSAQAALDRLLHRSPAVP